MAAGKSSRINRQYKTKYRIRNWREYERGLRSCGDVTIWLSEDAIAAWIPRRTVSAEGSVDTRTSRSSLRSPRPCDLLACQLASRRKDHGQVSIIMSVTLVNNLLQNMLVSVVAICC